MCAKSNSQKYINDDKSLKRYTLVDSLATAACTTGSEAHKFPFVGGEVEPFFEELSRKGDMFGK